MNEIERWYDEKYDEWSRLERHKVEFIITTRYMDEFIKGKALSIFDIGGGPDRYSIYLAKQGHKVTLLDLSKHNIEVAMEKSKESGVRLEGYIHGNALDIKDVNEQFDVILLMGPLYHLIKESDRRLAVESALSLLKPNGIIIDSFISNYAPIQDYIYDVSSIESADELLSYLKNGENKEENGFTTAYFINPYDAKDFMASFGLNQLAFAGVENILGSKETELYGLDESKFNQWLEIGYSLSKDSNLYGTSQHLLYIGQKFI